MTQHARIYTLLLCALMIVSLAACGNSSNPIVGEWSTNNPEIVFKFFQDGTVTWKQARSNYTGQYKFLDSANVRLDMMGDLGQQAVVLEDIKVSGDTLMLTLDGQRLTFSRTTASASSSQSTPTVKTMAVSLEDLAGQWESQQGDKITRYQQVLESDGRIRVYILTDPNQVNDKIYLDVKPTGDNKFTGTIAVLRNDQENGLYNVQIEVSQDKQVLTYTQQEVGKTEKFTYILSKRESGSAPKASATSTQGSSTDIRDLIGQWENQAVNPVVQVQQVLESDGRIKVTVSNSTPQVNEKTYLDVKPVGSDKFAGTLVVLHNDQEYLRYNVQIEISQDKQVLTIIQQEVGKPDKTTIMLRRKQ